MSERSDNVLIVGVVVGTRAALEELLSAIPANAGMSLLVLPHHEVDAEELAAHTPLAVRTAQDGAPIAANCVHLAERGARMGVRADGSLFVVPGAQGSTRSRGDRLFHSLASVLGRRAAGIVLPGAGGDGSRGLEAIRRAGGLALADSITSLAFGPPGSAVDLILPPREMPAALLRFAATDVSEATAEDASDGVLLGPEELRRIEALVQSEAGYRLGAYKPSVITRRVTRRMRLAGFQAVDRYLERLAADTLERELLTDDLLIRVTEFFREAPAFEALRQRVVVPLIEAAAPETTVRAWVAGCATGEEAYSIAMLLLEEASVADKPVKVHVFATDVHDGALALARSGVYPALVVEALREERRETFFRARDDGCYQVRPRLRDCVSFAHHDLCQDPPFYRMALVSCRNVLIYLRREMRDRVLQSLQFALEPNGFLFLGASESAGSGFETVASDARIYRRIPGSISRSRLVEGGQRFATANRWLSYPVSAAGDAAREPEHLVRARKLVHDLCTPPCVVVSPRGEVIYTHGDLQRYLRVPSGDPKLELAAMLREDIATRVRAAVATCRRDGRSIDLVSEQSAAEGKAGVRVRVQPAEALGKGHVLLAFEQTEARSVEGERVHATDQDAIIAELERELEATQEQLRYAIDQLECVNDELRAAHEEALSMNEELQSTNEELEASGAELRSVNQELFAVNADLRDKIAALEEARGDLVNFLNSSRLAAVFLDEHLCIRRVSPAASQLLELTQEHHGKPLAELPRELFTADDLAADARLVLERLAPVVREIETSRGSWFVRRVLPYHTESRQVAGVMVSFVEVTELKRATAALQTRERQQAVVARLGVKALQTEDVRKFMSHVVHEVRVTLDVEYCKILELQPSGQELLLREGVGWREGLVGRATEAAGLDSPGGYTLSVGEPVLVEDLERERRFAAPALLRDHGVKSGLSCAIQDRAGSYGVLGAYTRAARAFSQDDAHFLQSVAYLLATAVSRDKARRRLTIERGIAQLLSSANDLRDALPGALEVFARTLEAQAVELWEPCGEGNELERTASAERPRLRGGEDRGPRPRVSTGEAIVGRVFRQRAILYDYASSPPGRLEQVPWADDDVVCAFAFPVVVSDRTLGVIVLLCRERTVPDAALLDTLMATGHAMGELLRRTDARRRIIESEARYREIFEHAGVSLWEQDFSAVKSALDDLAEQGVSDFSRHFAEHPEFVDRCMDLVRIVDVNEETVRMFEASQKEPLLRSMRAIAGPESRQTFAEVLLALARGVELVSGQAPLRTLSGKPLHVVFSLRFDTGRPERLARVLVSLMDITEQKRIERELVESEERLHLALQAGHMGSWQWDIDTGEVLWSRELELIHGRPVGSFGGDFESFQQDMHPDDRAAVSVAIQRALAGDDSEIALEYRFVRPDGSVGWLDSRGMVLRDASGRAQRMLGVCGDITDRKDAERQLFESKQTLQLALSVGRMGTWDWDVTSRTIAINAEEAGHLGLPAVGRTLPLDELVSFAHPEDAARLRRTLGQERRLGDSYEVECRMIGADGVTRWLVYRGQVVAADGDRATRIVGVGSEVTELKHAVDALQEADRQKNQFLAMLGHELRNPLAAIRMATDLLALQRADDPLIGRAREVLDRQTTHMTKMVDGLLDVSRIVRGKIALEKTSLELGTVVAEALQDRATAIQAQGLELELDAGKRDLWIQGDRVRLAQVVDNLVANAMRFTHAPGKLAVLARREGGQAVVRVRDTGVGIAPALRDLIFEPFRQGPQDIARRAGGLGLGLALVKSIVDLHGGSVEASSDGVGKGAEFIVRLPLAAAPAVEPSKRVRRHDAGTLRIVVVEDNPDTAEIMKAALEALGHEAEVADAGDRALELIRIHEPDVVLCDLGLPVVSGYEVAARVRADERLKGIYLVALTGYGQSEDRHRTIEAGFDAHLVKPVDLDAIRDVLARRL